MHMNLKQSLTVGMKTQPGCECHHKDGNPLNNCKDNLLNIPTILHQLLHRNSEDNVSWHSKDNRWVARFRYNGKRYWIGEFKTKEEALIAFAKTMKVVETIEEIGMNLDSFKHISKWHKVDLLGGLGGSSI